MLSLSIVYILGLFAFFTDSSIQFAGIFTLLIIFMALRLNSLKMPIIYLLLFYFGFFYANYRVKPSDALYPMAPTNCKISGQISSVPTIKGDGKVKFFFDVDKVGNKEVSGKTLVTVKLKNRAKPKNSRDYLIGNHYEIEGNLRQPFTATNPSQFSYDKYLRNFNIYTTFYSEEDLVAPISCPISFKYKIQQYLNVKREDVIKSHLNYVKSPNIEILGGIVFGDDAIAPPDSIKESFIHSGLLHILAASGMNVAFISSFLFFFLSRLGVPYRPRTICAIVAIIFYALMTGLGASVVRAALMLIFVLLGKLIDRDTHSVALLSFVALLMLIYNPSYINDVGFQLSFIVTFGLLVSADAVMKYFDKVPLWLTGTIFVPIIAQAWVIPIQMFYFNTISLYSVFANIISMPILTVISCGGFASSVFALISPISDFVCKVFDFVLNPCLNLLVIISNAFAKLPHSLHITTHPSIIQILIYYAILLLCVYLLHYGFKNKKILKSILVLSLILFLSATIKLPNNNFEVISFDVGNADAFLLKTPNNKRFIIDTGKLAYDGGRSQADIIMLKYFKDKGIKEIDGMIITHYDSDHAGGAIDLINNLKIKTIYVNTLDDKKNLAKKIGLAIDSKPLIVKVLPNNNDIICEEIMKGKRFELKIIKANLEGTKLEDSDNENSLMTLATYGNNTMFFTGDAGVNALSRINNLPQDVTLFKVGHHGARGVIDKELFEKLNPKASLISVGINKYGHPSPITIKHLEKSKVLRTDKVNAIQVKFFNNDKYEISNFNSKTKKFQTRYKGVCKIN